MHSIFILFSVLIFDLNCSPYTSNFIDYSFSLNPEMQTASRRHSESAKDGAENESNAVNLKTNIGLINIEGDLSTARPIVNALRQLNTDEKIKGLIIYVNSTGGRLGTGETLLRELKKFKKNKPVIAVIENECLSSAYRAIASADYIFAVPSSEIGSVGTKWTIYKFKDIKYNADKESGSVDVYLIRAGKYKDSANNYTPYEPEQVEYIKGRLQKQYNQFVKDIAEARNLSIADEKIWADGKYFVGTEALELKLIDGIGDFSDALMKMKELLQARGSKIEGDFEIVEMKLQE